MVSHSFKSPKGGDPKAALDGWAWDAIKDDYVLTQPLNNEAQGVVDEAGGSVEPALSSDEFSRLYSSENFRSNIASLLSLGGAIAKLKSLDVDQADPAFAKAMEVAYTRLVNGPNAFVLKFMSNKDLVDFLIVSAWAGPFSKAVASEITEKKKAKAVAGQAKSSKAAGPKAGPPQQSTENLGDQQNVA